MNDVFEMADGLKSSAVIRVIGVGGGGCNTVEHMSRKRVEGVELFCANTDRKHLEGCVTQNQIQLGNRLTRGLGAGSKAEVGRAAAEEDRERIAELLKGTDLLFLTAGMGGGTGTGAAPVIAEIAREMNILTVAVVTKPFTAEGPKRNEQAIAGISKLAETVDSLIIIPNDKLRLVLGGKVPLKEAFAKADDVLNNAVMGISDLITRPGFISVDFADVQTVMTARGMAMMGVGMGTGEDRAKQAVEAALSSPLLDDITIQNARGLLINVTCDDSLTLDEQHYIQEQIGQIAAQDAEIKCGTALDESMNGELRVTVVATGLPGIAKASDVHITPPNSFGRRMPAQAPPPPSGPRMASLTTPGQFVSMQAPGMQPATSTPQAYEYGPKVGNGYPQLVPVPRSAPVVATPSRSIAQSVLDDLDDESLNIPAYLRKQAD